MLWIQSDQDQECLQVAGFFFWLWIWSKFDYRTEMAFVFCIFGQIKREISTMKRVKHPNIVQLLEVSYCSI
jgi:hypothetical protein